LKDFSPFFTINSNDFDISKFTKIKDTSHRDCQSITADSSSTKRENSPRCEARKHNRLIDTKRGSDHLTDISSENTNSRLKWHPPPPRSPSCTCTSPASPNAGAKAPLSDSHTSPPPVRSFNWRSQYLLIGGFQRAPFGREADAPLLATTPARLQ